MKHLVGTGEGAAAASAGAAAAAGRKLQAFNFLGESSAAVTEATAPHDQKNTGTFPPQLFACDKQRRPLHGFLEGNILALSCDATLVGSASVIAPAGCGRVPFL